MQKTQQRPRVTFVVPRYLPEMIGGAETLVQGYAEQLSARGYSIEVLTTCADQLGAPKNALAPGEDLIRGVRVRRFPLDAADPSRYWRLANQLSRAGTLEYRQQRALLQAGLNSAELCDYLQGAAANYEAVIVGPYAFALTFAAARAAAGKAIWLPCLHDEPLAHLAVVREALEEARGILFNTEAELRFARERLGLANPAAAVVGYGFAEAAPGDAARFRERYSLPGPLLLYAGRIIPEKNVGQLLDLFGRYRAERNPAATLALVGEGAGVDLERPGVRGLGPLSAADLRDAYAAADLFCQPSRNESFSIVIMEAWQQRRPVLVHADCAVTHEHVVRSGGGWLFADYESFAAAVAAAIEQPGEARASGERGHAYVCECYAWPVVAARLERALAELLAPRSLARELSQRGVRRALEFTREHYHARLGDLLSEVLPGPRHLSVEQLLAPLRQQGALGVPGYQVESRLPLVGRMIGWLRRNLTSHLKEPYIDALAQQQTTFNLTIVEQLRQALEHAQREQRQLERRVRSLEAEIHALRQTADVSITQHHSTRSDQ